MTDRNTMSPLGYLLANVWWGTVAIYYFQEILFTGLSGFSWSGAEWRLWLLIALYISLGVLVTWSRRRNYVSVAANVLLPIGLLALLVYHPYLPVLTGVILGVTCVPAIGFFLLVMLQKGTRAGYGARAAHGLLAVRTILAFGTFVFVVALNVRLLFGSGIMTSRTPPAASVAASEPEAEEWTVKNQIDRVRLLEEEEWSKLTVQEKLDVLGVIVNIEVNYLGISHEVCLKGDVLEGDTAAYYNHGEHEVVIDVEYLETAAAQEALNSICHECYHSYQHQLVELHALAPEAYKDLLLFDYAKEYASEFADYIDASEDPMEYYYQTVEVKAREYARVAVMDYYDLIDEYTSGEDE